jgi:hypothetical protein
MARVRPEVAGELLLLPLPAVAALLIPRYSPSSRGLVEEGRLTGATEEGGSLQREELVPRGRRIPSIWSASGFCGTRI